MRIKSGDKWAPLGRSTQEAMGVIAAGVAQLNLKLNVMEKKAKEELKEMGIFVGRREYGEPHSRERK